MLCTYFRFEWCVLVFLFSAWVSVFEKKLKNERFIPAPQALLVAILHGELTAKIV